MNQAGAVPSWKLGAVRSAFTKSCYLPLSIVTVNPMSSLGAIAWNPGSISLTSLSTTIAFQCNTDPCTLSITHSLCPLVPGIGDSQHSHPLQHGGSVGRPPTNGRQPLHRGQSGTGSGTRQKESLFQRIKRAASQPALAGPSAPPMSQVAQSAIASVSSISRSDSR